MIPAGARPPAPRVDRSPPCRRETSRTTSPAPTTTASTPASDTVVWETQFRFDVPSVVSSEPPGLEGGFAAGAPRLLDSFAETPGPDVGTSGRARALSVTSRAAASQMPVLRRCTCPPGLALGARPRHADYAVCLSGLSDSAGSATI